MPVGREVVVGRGYCGRTLPAVLPCRCGWCGGESLSGVGILVQVVI